MKIWIGRIAAAIALLALATPQAALAQTASASQQGQASATRDGIRQRYADFAPKYGAVTADVLYGDIWERPDLSKRDRSLITVSALIAMYRPDQLRSHLIRARENGVTEAEVVETITHLAFYAGWPSASTALNVAREVYRGEAAASQRR